MASPFSSQGPAEIKRPARGSVISMTSMCTSRGSTFRSLVNSKNTKHKTLPTFLRAKQAKRPVSVPFFSDTSTSEGSEEGLDLLRRSEEFDLLSSGMKAPKAKSALIDFSESSMEMRSRATTEERDKVEVKRRQEAEIKRVYEAAVSKGDLNETLLTIKSASLTRDDLSRLLSKVEVSRRVLQAYFSILNQLNQSMCLVKGAADKVKIFRISFSQDIFSKGRSTIVHAKKDIMKNDFLLFPIFVGYWTLLEVNIRERSIAYHDPLKKYSYLEDLLVSLFQYMKSELMHHQQREIEHTIWRDIYYKSTSETARFTNADSGVYIMRHAWGYVKNQPASLKKEDLNEYRRKVFNKLVASPLKCRI